MKKFLALLLCLVLAASLVACGGTENPPTDSGTNAPSSNAGTDSFNSSIGSNLPGNTTDSSGNGSSDSGEGDVATPVENKVLGIDQQSTQVILYNLDLLEPGDDLDLAIEWKLQVGWAAGVKYREDTVFGDVIIVAGSVSGIYSYPGGKALWTTNNPGNNSHSIEILPSGNVVIANSTGCCLRMFYSSAILDGDTTTAQRFKDYELEGAHGALWDPENDVLWAVGDYDLVAYSVTGSGTEEKLSRVSGLGAPLPTDATGGHDLSADFSDVNALYVSTNSKVLRFNKDEGEWEEKYPQYGKLSERAVKGFGNNENGNFFLCFPNGGKGTAWEKDSKASWCTDRLYFCYWKSENYMYKQEFVSSTAAFYKVRAFCGRYQ